VQFWPDKKNLVGRQVEQLVNGDKPVDAAALGKSSVVVRGLSAYEYILFDSKPDVASAEQKARYCPLLVAIGEHQKHWPRTSSRAGTAPTACSRR
jgi:predicted lipoprotein